MPRYRLEYMKKDIARYLSHRELMTTLQRAMKRATFPLTYTMGHHPRPKLSFGPPLAVGVAGLREYMDLELDREISTLEYLQLLNDHLPPGLRAQDLVKLDPGEMSLGKFINCACYRIEAGSAISAISWEQLFNKLEEEYPGLTEGLLKWCANPVEGYLEVLMQEGQGGVSLRTLLDALNQGIGTTLLLPSLVTRTALFHLAKGLLTDPLKKYTRPL
ncbi:MAG TPA: DUF2344 domain-containing protein [Syntrophomonadaceae bacterium]|nr:DUF2344 domain-containing protein [Syntrophomonadaceae bacterium]